MKPNTDENHVLNEEKKNNNGSGRKTECDEM